MAQTLQVNPLQSIITSLALEKAQPGIQATAIASAQFYSILVANGMPSQAATAVTQTWLTTLMLGGSKTTSQGEVE